MYAGKGHLWETACFNKDEESSDVLSLDNYSDIPFVDLQ